MMRYLIKIIIVAAFGVAGLITSALAADDWILRSKDSSLPRDAYNKTLEARGFTASKLSEKQQQALLQELFIRGSLLEKQSQIPVDQFATLEKKLADYRQSQIAKLTLDVLSETGMPDFNKRAKELYEARKNDQYQLPLRLRVRILRQKFNAQNKEQVIKSLSGIMEKVAAGELDFKQAVLKSSDDENKKLTEGDSFWFHQGQKPEVIYDAAKKLNAEHLLSEIIIYKNSVFLLKFIGRKESVLRSFAEVKESILAELKAGYRNEQRKLLLSDLRNRFKSEVEIHPDFK